MSGEGGPEAGFPNLWQGAGLALVYLALHAWLGTVVQIVAPTLGLPAWTCLLPGEFLGFPLALAFGVWVGKLDVWDILAFKRVRPAVWPPLLMTHLGFLILIQALGHGLGAGLDFALPEELRRNLLKDDPLTGASSTTLAFLFASAALPEEVLFRGLILRGFLRRHRPVLAIWLSAGLFMAAHGNPLQFPVALMIGACAGWYYQATGSLWPGIVAHGLHNFLVGLWTRPEAAQAGSFQIHPLPPLPWLLAAPFLAGLGLLWLRWAFQRPVPVPRGVLGLEG